MTCTMVPGLGLSHQFGVKLLEQDSGHCPCVPAAHALGPPPSASFHTRTPADLLPISLDSSLEPRAPSHGVTSDPSRLSLGVRLHCLLTVSPSPRSCCHPPVQTWGTC